MQSTIDDAAGPPAAAVRPDTGSIEVHPLTVHIGAELRNVSLADAARDGELFAELKGLLLQHKVLFLRDQDISWAEHVALAQRFGSLEDHPVASSDPDHPGLVRIYKDLDSPAEHYENAYHCDATWREAPPMGCVLRCVETPPVGGDTIWVNMAEAYRRLPQDVKERIDGLRARHSIEASFGANMPIEAHAPGDGRAGPVRQRVHHAFHELPHPGQRAVRFRLRPRRQRAAQLPDPSGGCSGVPGALALDAQQLRDLGQPLDAALRRAGLLARRSQDGTRRGHRRQDLLTCDPSRPVPP
jgi:alpha-ketoglutarate-dependent taurine dioxygenase